MWSNDTVEWIDIELTSYCNIDCPGCLRQVKRDRVGSILDKDILTFENTSGLRASRARGTNILKIEKS